MSDASNPYQSPQASPKPSGIPQQPEPKSLWEAVRRGTWLGFKWTSYIVGPLAIFIFIIFIGVLIFTLLIGASGELLDTPKARWQTIKGLASPFGMYFASCLWGIIAGVVICVVQYLVKRIRSKGTQQETTN